MQCLLEIVQVNSKYLENLSAAFFGQMSCTLWGQNIQIDYEGKIYAPESNY